MYHSGVISTSELKNRGFSQKDISRAIELGRFARIGRGWFARPDADGQAVRAIRAGGQLGCLSGLAARKLWVPRFQDLHVVYGQGSRPAPRAGIQFHPTDQPRQTQAVWPLLDCLQQVAHRHDAETALVTFESALNLRLATLTDLHLLLSTLPKRTQRIGAFLGRAESGSETRVRYFLQRRNFSVRAQISIPGVGRVDLLVGDRLIVECDSDAHHRSKEAHQEDRRRDLAARDLGLDVVRLTYHQIWLDWPATQLSLLRLLRTRRHHYRHKNGYTARRVP